MIHILSAGRSGSAWLCAVFQALGLKSQHDGYPAFPEGYRPDVAAESGWLWYPLQFFMQAEPGDTVIILNRPRKDIEHSVSMLLGCQMNWEELFVNWEAFKTIVKDSNHFIVHELDYTDLFKPEFSETIEKMLEDKSVTFKKGHIEEVLNLFRHLKITNKSIEQDVKDTHFRNQPQGIAL